MLNKNDIKELLNVNNIFIDDVKTFIDNKNPLKNQIIIDVHLHKSVDNLCPHCGKKCEVYDLGQGIRKWRSLDFGDIKVYIRSMANRVYCSEHGAVVKKFPWARHDSWFTHDFEQTVAWLAVNSSKKVISQFMRISWNTVGPIITRIKNDLDINPATRYENLKIIGVDETSYKKQRKYLTLIVDHVEKCVIWVHIKHGKSIFEEFFKELNENQRGSIEIVSGDGAKWIDECMNEYTPLAIRVIDPFHAVKWVSDALDELRKQRWRELYEKEKNKPKRKRGRPKKDEAKNDKTTAKDIKGTKPLLLCGNDKLTDSQRAKLDIALAMDSKLNSAYTHKEAFRAIFKMTDVADAAIELDKWLSWARRSQIKEFVELYYKIKKHR